MPLPWLHQPILHAFRKRIAWVIRIDDRSNCEKVALLVEKAFGHVQMSTSIGSCISGRVWLELGPYPREIAEARAEVVRRNARLGRMNLEIHM